MEKTFTDVTPNHFTAGDIACMIKALQLGFTFDEAVRMTASVKTWKEVTEG